MLSLSSQLQRIASAAEEAEAAIPGPYVKCPRERIQIAIDALWEWLAKHENSRAVDIGSQFKWPAAKTKYYFLALIHKGRVVVAGEGRAKRYSVRIGGERDEMS